MRFLKALAKGALAGVALALLGHAILFFDHAPEDGPFQVNMLVLFGSVVFAAFVALLAEALEPARWSKDG